MIESEAALPAAATEERWSWPPLFGLLEIQFGAAVGFLQTAVPYWLAKDGMPLADIGVLSGAAFSPHAWKLLWVPLIDLGPWRRIWYGVSTLLTALFLLACALLPEPSKHLAVYTLLLTGLQAAASTAHAALNGLMAITTRIEDKGRTGGWQMAGNVGSTSLLGALAIWLASTFSRQVAGIVLAVLVLGSGAGIFWIVERQGEQVERGPLLSAAWARVKGILVDLMRTAFSRDGLVMLVLCLLPVSCGALTNLFSAMAGDYHAPEHVVELVNGLGMGVTGALGSLVGGWVSDRGINRKLNYALMGGATGLCALIMASAPMTPTTYIWGTLLYSFANGASFAAFAGMVLEMVSAGAAVTTKYTLFVAASNLAISYVTALDGNAASYRVFGTGTRASITFDGVITFAGIAVVVALFLLFLRKKPQPAATTA